jgi:ADP-heptose:LPS heptosyltransferase
MNFGTKRARHKRKRFIVFCNSPSIRFKSILRLILRKWPGALVLLVAKRPIYLDHETRKCCHVYRRKSPISLQQGFGLVRHFAEFRFDGTLVRRHDLTLKLVLCIFILRTKSLYLIRPFAQRASMQRFGWKDFLEQVVKKRGLLLSAVLSILPSILCLLLVPAILLAHKQWENKKELLRTIRSNILSGPLADSPWLLAWLQVAMIYSFLFSRKPADSPTKILVIRTDHIGDAVNTVPLMRYLRNTYPSAHISMLCDSGQFIWRYSPYVDEVIPYRTNNRLFNRGGRKKLRHTFRPMTFLGRIRRGNFDLVIDPVGRTETHILSCLCTMARRVSNSYYPYKLYGVEVPIRHYETSLHEARRVLSLVLPARSITRQQCCLESWLTADMKEKARQVLALRGLAQSDRILGIHPGAMSRLRLWPMDRMAAVAAELVRRFDMELIFFEAPGTGALTAAFSQHCANYRITPVIIAVNDLNLLTGVIEQCRLFVCLDSGPMHLAAATGTPQVSIFGPGEYWRWRPRLPASAVVRIHMDCAPCSQDFCTNPVCMLSITPEHVLGACYSVLAKTGLKRTRVLEQSAFS